MYVTGTYRIQNETSQRSIDHERRPTITTELFSSSVSIKPAIYGSQMEKLVDGEPIKTVLIMIIYMRRTTRIVSGKCRKMHGIKSRARVFEMLHMCANIVQLQFMLNEWA